MENNKDIILNNSDIFEIMKNLDIYSIELIDDVHNDINHPYIVYKDNDKFKLCINRKYYTENNIEANSVVKNAILNCKSDRFIIDNKELLNDEVIQLLCHNGAIKTITIDKNFLSPYVLTKAHYEIFKQYNKIIDTSSVCEELKDIFDDTILHNYDRFLIGTYNYENLVNRERISIMSPLKVELLSF